MADELKPCPACNGKAIIYTVIAESYGYWPSSIGVKCTSCGLARGSSATTGYDWVKRKHVDQKRLATQDVTDRWNNRVMRDWFEAG